MKCLRDERGAALVIALMLTFLALAIIGAILYMVTQGLQVSAASKKYRNSLEASYGGAELVTKDLMTQIYTGAMSATKLQQTFASVGLSFGGYTSCVKHKLVTATKDWSMGTTNVCGPNAKSFDPNAGAKQYPDITFTLGGVSGQPNFKAYAQIVDTVPGNSDKSGTAFLDTGAGVAGSGAGISPIHVPAVFTIEVQGEKATNPLERARLSVLYSY